MLRTTSHLLLAALLLPSCIIGEDPDFGTEGGTTGETGETDGTTTPPEEGELWCSFADGATVSHNGQPVPPAFGGPFVQDEQGEWMAGCTCADSFDGFSLHFYDGQQDGQFDGFVVIPDDHLYADLRDQVHGRTVVHCAQRAFEMAEAFFCANFCGEPYNYEWEDFAALTEHTCVEQVPDTEPLYAIPGETCVVGDPDPLPGN